MQVKANLRVVLLADDVTVAESEDAALWQYTLASITGQGDLHSRANGGDAYAGRKNAQSAGTVRDQQKETEPQLQPLEVFARDLRLEPTIVQGACDPDTEPPYLHLDVRAWQTFKRNTPERGNTSIPSIVLAATLLVLWSKKIGLNTVTIQQAQAVLETIDTRDKNAGRGLRNCNWLQTREDNIKLNPARFDQALAVARAFCSQSPIEEDA